MGQTYKAEQFFAMITTQTVMVPVQQKVWSGIFMPVDISRLRDMIETDSTHQYWIQIDDKRPDGIIYIDGMGKDLRKKKDIPPDY